MSIKIFCVPHAGGSASAFNRWKGLFNDTIELVPLELAGRGGRYGETLSDSIHGIASDLFDRIRIDLNQEPYAFWGHSFGTVIIYELMRMIKDNKLNMPVHIFMTGRFPPHRKEQNEIRHLPEDDFIKEIISLGGVESQIAENKEILKFYYPILKADYSAIETYMFTAAEAWSCNLTIMSGDDDKEVEEASLIEWQRYTNNQCDIKIFAGGHFFIYDYVDEITQIINGKLLSEVSKYIIEEKRWKRGFGL